MSSSSSSLLLPSMVQVRLKEHDQFFRGIVAMLPLEIAKEDPLELEMQLNAKYFKHKKAPLTLDEKKSLSKKRKNEKYSLGQGSSNDDEGHEEDENINVIPVDLTKLALPNKKKSKNTHNTSTSSSSSLLNNNSKVAQLSPPSEASHESLHQSLLVDSSSQSSSVEYDFNGLTHLSSSALTNTVGKPGSKVKRLKRMLSEAEAKRQRLEDLKRSGGEFGSQLVQEELWSDALVDATGAKSVNDTKKLRKALKRIDKNKEKSAAEWQDRLSAVEDGKRERQERRESNLKARGKKGADNLPVTGDSSNDGEKGKKIGRFDPNYARKHAHDNEDDGGKDKKGNNGGNKNSHSQAAHRPGFEGKKKANGEFLNQRK